MMNKILNSIFIRAVIIIILALPFSILHNTEAYSKQNNTKNNTKLSKSTTKKVTKKKKIKRVPHNRQKTIEETQDIIRKSSPYLCALTGLEPYHSIYSQSEIDSILQTEGENIAELELEDDIQIDFDNMDDFRNMLNAFINNDNFSESEITPAGINKKELVEVIMDMVGTRYKFGGNTTAGIDCSAFVQYCFQKTANIILPRTAREQFNVGKSIPRNKLQFGDLVFFHTYSRAFASHVGIYLGDNLFAHSSTKGGVKISSLESTYYNKRFIGGKRLEAKDISRFSIN